MCCTGSKLYAEQLSAELSEDFYEATLHSLKSREGETVGFVVIVGWLVGLFLLSNVSASLC